MKTMCPPGYHHNGFMATHAPGHMMYGLHELPQSHYGDSWEGTLFSWVLKKSWLERYIQLSFMCVCKYLKQIVWRIRE